MLRKLYDWVLHWAHTPYGTPALALLAFVESSFFPIPPDPLLMALCLSRIKKSLFYALVCSISSVLGGILGYLIGYFLWELIGDFFFTYIPGFTPAIFTIVQSKYQEHAFWAIFTAGLTPIPYKVFTIAGGVFQIDLVSFITASILGRSLRFFVVAGLLRLYGEKIKIFIEKYFNLLSIVFVILLILGFVIIKILLPRG